MPVFVIQLIVMAVMTALAILLAPKVHTPAPPAQQTPTASAGTPIPRAYGLVWLNPNSLGYWQISEYSKKVKIT